MPEEKQVIALLDIIDLALRANNGGTKFQKNRCTCDPSVGMSPCEYCAIQRALEKCKDFVSLILIE